MVKIKKADEVFAKKEEFSNPFYYEKYLKNLKRIRNATKKGREDIKKGI